METIKHTPGPWTAVEEYQADGPGPYGARWRVDPVTQDDGMSYGYRWLRETDARLIAAAPDLLAELRHTHGDLWRARLAVTVGTKTKQKQIDFLLGVMAQAEKRMDALIARIDGRQP